ncbi:AAA family ATPase [Lusitaniella coriacea LEGE 07157]|uniref:histidine kinase n=1 Tax=Lusitaniella coriacea LEGE 07157 TaxID=945747 RepID=A0A8J7B884_9CYAN|nr:AAA family ATPase [Lusitaniella coriacea]MBE9115180.1 AAA family ATPase [Lusitaniella coriacea LEGE 07157]
MNSTPITFNGYRLIELIHSSSRILVYRGQRTRDSQFVIIKLLRSPYPSISELIQFRNQYAISKNLDFPGIVCPFALESYNNGYALIMPDKGDISLLSFAFDRPLLIIEFLEIGIQLAGILHKLYENRVIHKDIKPANILIHPDTKQVKLIDFSLASLLPKETQEVHNPNVLEGTLAYISPEQTGRMNQKIDYRADFYSLGVTFYELLAGELPFTSNDPMELVHCHIAKVPMSLGNGGQRTGNSEKIPQVLSDMVMKLMAKNVEERYQSALGLKYDLEWCLKQWTQTAAIEAFELGKRDVRDRFIIPEKLYGREKEVTQLLAAFERVSQVQSSVKAGGRRQEAEGKIDCNLSPSLPLSVSPRHQKVSPSTLSRSELVLVAGYSGVGKTSVVNEVHKPIVRQRGYFMRGKFDQFNRNIPFSAFVQAFRDLIEQLLSETNDRLKVWKRKILTALGDNGQVIIEVVPELEYIIGKQPPVSELSGNAAQNRFNLLFSKFIRVFTKKEHPLAIFLDDLQWADLASLELMKLLVKEDSTGYLLLIGAYRDNEVDPTHPLMLALHEIERTEAILTRITLAPLSQSGVNQLVADTLSCSYEQAVPLTEQVYQKTQGNPFFTTQFLKSLYEEGWISFNGKLGYWECDRVEILQLSLADDVVKFMATQLQKLPVETQTVLKFAACIGAQFDLNTLAIVCARSRVDIATVLWSALREGSIVPVTTNYKFFQGMESLPQAERIAVPYRFLHDRIQQAAYSLISWEQKQSTHLNIGTLLLKKLSVAEREDRIFEIVNHLNIGRELITQLPPRKELAKLNLLAGKKAKASTAYAGALSQIEIGIELLPGDCWESDYDLSFELYRERAELEYLNGNFEAAETWIDRVLENAKTPMEKAEVYKISIVQYTLQAKYPEAIQAGRQALALIDVELPEDNFEAVRDAELAIAQKTLKNRSFASLADLPLMTQPQKKMAIAILISIGPPTYRSHQKLWSVICAKAVNLCLQYGNTPESGYIYPAFGGLRGYALNDYQGTGELLDATLQFIKTLNNKSAESVTYLMIGSSLRHWSHPLKFATEDYLASYQVGLASSNLQYAAYAFGHNMYCRFYQSIRLETLFEEIAESLAFSQKYKNQWAIDLLMGGQRIVTKLMGIQTDGKSETDYRDWCRNHKNWQVLCIYNILRTQLLFVEGRLEEALACGQEAEAAIINIAPQGLLPYAHHLFIYALLLASLHPKTSEPQQSENWAQISTYQKQLESWAQNCPENFLHLCSLVKAEMARLSGDRLEAMELYDLAIAQAKENKYLQEEALAGELAAEFYLNWGKEIIAKAYLTQAYYCYAHWGAKAKVDALEQQYPQLLANATTNPLPNYLTNTHSSSTSGEVLDLATVLKASQTISQEIASEQLLGKLMQLLLENAGAQTGCLILPQGGNLRIEATVAIDSDYGSLLESLPLEERVPTSIVQLVARTQKSIVISDGRKELQTSRDPYIRTYKPRSILCAPLLNCEDWVGIVYLENNAIAGAFTPERLDMVRLLSTQAAIAILNAKLYAQVRTNEQQLQQFLNALPIGVFVTANDGRPYYINPLGEEMLHRGIDKSAKPEELTSIHRTYIAGTQENYPQERMPLFKALQGENSTIDDLEIHTPDRIIAIEARGNPIRDERGNITYAIATFQDITQRKQAEQILADYNHTLERQVIERTEELANTLKNLKITQEQLIHTEKMAALGNLMAGIAHELRNPLNFVNNLSLLSSELIEELNEMLEPLKDRWDSNTNESITEILSYLSRNSQEIHQNGERATNIISMMLMQARSDNLQKQPTDLNTLLEQTVDLVCYSLRDPGGICLQAARDPAFNIQIQQDYDPTLPLINTVSQNLNRAFINLIDNACYALWCKWKNTQTVFIPTLSLKTINQGDSVEIHIQDNGTGIDPKTQAKMFNPFFTTKPPGEGTGLGLSLTYEIIAREHTGTIHIETEVGIYTKLIVNLPLNAPTLPKQKEDK